MYVAIDFDGTITEHAYPYIGTPALHAIRWMRRFRELGADLILYTMRSGKELQNAVDYCSDNGVEFYAVNDNPSQVGWTGSRKIYAHVYVDDAALGCPLSVPRKDARPVADWLVIGPLVEAMLKGEIPALGHADIAEENGGVK